MNASIVNDLRFGKNLLGPDCTITVSSYYNHGTQIDTHAEKVRKLKSTYYYNKELTSKNFAKATSQLVPGKTYAIRMIPILETVEGIDCLNRQKAEPGNVLVGAQG